MDERDYLLVMSSRDFLDILARLEKTEIVDVYHDLLPEIHAIRNRIRRICARLDAELVEAIKRAAQEEGSAS